MVNLIKPRAELVFTWGSEELVAAMTDVVYRAYSIEDAIRRVREKPELVQRRITGFLRDGHHSVLEFMGASWILEGSRAFTHELVRHRVASYWQESQRYVDYAKGQLRYVLPPSLAQELAGFLRDSSQTYVKAREGFAPEDARYLLPNAMASRVWVQMNAREFFMNFMPLRSGLGAFHEIRLIAWLMFSTLIDKFPIIAKWIWENLPRLHPDYCRDIDKLKDLYGTDDCRLVSIEDSFRKWQIEIPEALRALMGSR
ncbi:MAG: FAD-dependent thymidylate synthase [Vulcanisaeta sp.]|jgi:thymidylate synthase (FAD)|uniref:FAD-dependent thymidylate synthase n=1 Tax=Vulcanisaeta sp. TaxID=2020871 RepID=UPI003D105C9A